MDITILSYSYSGKNKKLATSLAQKLSAKHISFTTVKPMSFFRIALHMLFGTKPALNEQIPEPKKDELVLFIAPIWMGQIASPLKRCFQQLKGKIENYAFISISGGALGPNPKITSELTKRMGKAPKFVIDRQAVEFLKLDHKPTPKETDAYDFSDEDCASIVDEVVAKILS